MDKQEIVQSKKVILIANGVNLDLLGSRESGLYGKKSLDDLKILLNKSLPDFEKIIGKKGFKLEFFQTNSEEAYLQKLTGNWAGILLNPGAWTHTSLALADRLRGIRIPYVEVHITNLSCRDNVRQHSFTAADSRGVVYGFGLDSYLLGMLGLMRCLVNH